MESRAVEPTIRTLMIGMSGDRVRGVGAGSIPEGFGEEHLGFLHEGLKMVLINFRRKVCRGLPCRKVGPRTSHWRSRLSGRQWRRRSRGHGLVSGEWVRGEFGGCDGVPGESLERRLLGGRHRGINAGVAGVCRGRRSVAVKCAGRPVVAVISRGQKSHDETVLVRAPCGTVEALETRAGALFAAKHQRAVEESWGKPFEPDRDFQEGASQGFDHGIDHPGTDGGFANARR